MLRYKKCSYPCVYDRILDLVQKKHAAEETTDERRLRDECNAGAVNVAREREHLKHMRKSSEGGWSRAHKPLKKQGQTSSIPVVRGRTGEWLMEA